MLVFIAHNGKAYEVEVRPATRVKAVQESLSQVCGIDVANQILLSGGQRLESGKSLKDYQLPKDGDEGLVFLYSKEQLRPGAPLPEEEELPDIAVRELHVHEGAALPLHAAADVQELQQCERTFRHHWQAAAGMHEAAHGWLQYGCRVHAEMTRQQVAVQMAFSNMDSLFSSSIVRAFEDFVELQDRQHAYHEKLLRWFDRNVKQLQLLPLHPGLRSEQAQSLVHLLPPDYMESRDACHKSHTQFSQKVEQLKQAEARTAAAVQALMRLQPPVDLQRAELELAEKERLVESQRPVITALQQDFRKVQEKVEAIAQAQGLQEQEGAAAGILDEVRAMQEMAAHHEGLLTDARQQVEDLRRLALRCQSSKGLMTEHVVKALQEVSKLQKDMMRLHTRVKAYKEASAEQERRCTVLRLVYHLPLAYKRCMAECMRRQGWAEKNAVAVRKVAEQLAVRRGQELHRRAAFRSHIERFVPVDVLERMGLIDEPAQVQMTLSPADTGLLQVTAADLQPMPSEPPPHAPATPPAVSGATAALQPALSRGSSPRQPPPAGTPPSTSPREPPPVVWQQAEGGGGDASALQLENVNLRCQVAEQAMALCLVRLHAIASPHQQQLELGVPPGGDAAAAQPEEEPAAEPQLPHHVAKVLQEKDALLAELRAQLADAKARVARLTQQQQQQQQQAAAAEAGAASPGAPPPSTPEAAGAAAEGRPAGSATASVGIQTEAEPAAAEPLQSAVLQGGFMTESCYQGRQEEAILPAAAGPACQDSSVLAALAGEAAGAGAGDGIGREESSASEASLSIMAGVGSLADAHISAGGAAALVPGINIPAMLPGLMRSAEPTREPEPEPEPALACAASLDASETAAEEHPLSGADERQPAAAAVPQDDRPGVLHSDDAAGGSPAVEDAG